MFKPVYGFISIILTALHNADASGRFVEIPAGTNGTKLVDLEARPDVQLLTSIGNVNKYLLFTRQNPTSPEYLSPDDEGTIKESNFNPDLSVAVLIHGWQSQPSRGVGQIVRKALLDKTDVNVIVMDWRKISSLDYITAVEAVPTVGQNLGAFLQYLNSLTGVPFSSMHLIGHSLGAHIAANAGRKLGGRIARITGLDPAGPLWYTNSNQFRKTDAVYVEAIHTNGLGLGIEKNVADVDFYPNGGTLQPGCFFRTACNHGRSYELFAASIEYPNHLIGKKCDNTIQMGLGQCRGSELPLGNDDLRKTGSGVYRLDTRSKYPF